jgi:hypothetical protein
MGIYQSENEGGGVLRMSRMTYAALIAAIAIPGASPSLAELGVTDACQEEADELQDKIDDNADDYTAESRRKAKNHLLAARTNRMDPVKCRGNILDARKELQEGKRDKNRKDRD